MQNARAAKCKLNFVFLDDENNVWLERYCYSVSGERWKAMAKIFSPSRRENGSFEVWLVRPIFTKGGCTCFNGYFQRKKPNPSHVQIGPITGRRLPWRFFGCSPRNQGCTWLGQFGHIFSEVWQKCTKVILVQPGPKRRKFNASSKKAISVQPCARASTKENNTEVGLDKFCRQNKRYLRRAFCRQNKAFTSGIWAEQRKISDTNDMHNSCNWKMKLNKYKKYKNNYTVFMHLFDVSFCKMLIKNSLFRLISVI